MNRTVRYFRDVKATSSNWSLEDNYSAGLYWTTDVFNSNFWVSIYFWQGL